MLPSMPECSFVYLFSFVCKSTLLYFRYPVGFHKEFLLLVIILLISHTNPILAQFSLQKTLIHPLHVSRLPVTHFMKNVLFKVLSLPDLSPSLVDMFIKTVYRQLDLDIDYLEALSG